VTSSKPATYGVRTTGEGDVLTAVPAGQDWSLEIDGREVKARSAYGWAARFDGPGRGTGTLHHQANPVLLGVTLAQPALWAVVVIMCVRLRRPSGRDRQATTGAAP
jgi:hypothetical protein